jgi:hypothetical protein
MLSVLDVGGLIDTYGSPFVRISEYEMKDIDMSLHPKLTSEE